MADFRQIAAELGVRLRVPQQRVLERLEHVDRTVRVVQAPTGTGKSLIGLIEAIKFGGRAYIIAPTIYLQNQYQETIKKFRIDRFFSHPYVMYGRGNFVCAKTGLPASSCPLLFFKKAYCKYAPQRFFSEPPSDYFYAYAGNGWFVGYDPGAEMCPYWRSKIDALRSDLVVMNYDYFFLDYFFVKDFPVPTVLIFDEAHSVFDKLASRLTVFVPPDVVSYLSPDGLSGPQLVLEFADGMRRWAENVLDHVSGGREYRRALELLEVSSFMSAVPEVFRVKRISRGSHAGWYVVNVEPVSLVARVVKDIADRVVAVYFFSATMGPPYLWERVFGKVGFGDWYYIDYPEHPFRVENRLVFVPDDAPYVSAYGARTEQSLHLYWATSILVGYRLLEDLGVRPSVLVHAYLVDVADAVYDFLQELSTSYGVDPGAVSVATGEGSRDYIYEWRKYGGILVTTAANEGVDLPGDDCRLQYILKTPYPNVVTYPRDLYDYYVSRTLVQMSGRIVRTPTDWGYTIVLDRSAWVHMQRRSGFYPQWFLDAVRADLTLGEIMQYIESDIRRRLAHEAGGLPGGEEDHQDS